MESREKNTFAATGGQRTTSLNFTFTHKTDPKIMSKLTSVTSPHGLGEAAQYQRQAR